MLVARPVSAGPGNFDDRASDTRSLAGIYATSRLRGIEQGGLDLYLLTYTHDDARFEQGTGRERRQTLGARFFGNRSGGTVRISVCGRAVEHYAAMALMKRSPKMTANWALAMDHSRGGIFHSFSDRFKIR